MDFLLLVIFLLISAAFGMRILGLFKFNFEDFKEKVAFSLSLGLGLIAYIVFISGLFGLLYRWYLISLLLILGLFSFKQISNILKQLFHYIGNLKLKELPFLFLIFLLLAVILTLLGGSAPPIGNDSLAYRLAQVRIFAEGHRLIYIPYTRESLWPYLIEMLFTLGIVISSDILAKLIAWSFGLLSAFLVYIVAGRYFSKRAGYISSLIFLLTPAIFTQMTYSYVDIPQALYSFVTLISILKYIESRNIRWAGLAGLFCGFVLSIKYTGVLTLFTLMAVFTYHFAKQKDLRRIILKGVILFLLFTILFSFCWYLRSYLIKGNPIYPYFARFFGHHGWERATEELIGSRFSISGVFKLPWMITMLPEEFGGEHFGVIYLLFLPLVFLIDRNKDIFKSLGVFIIFYATAWFFVDPYVNRFLFPILLPLSLLVGCGLSVIFSKAGFFSNFVKGVFVIVCIFNTGLLLYHNTDKIKVAVGLESRQEYLSRTERTYNIAEYINKNLPQDATILMAGEIRAYYIKRPYIHLENLIDEEKIPPQLLEKKEFLKELKKYKIDYILCSEEETTTHLWLGYNRPAVFSCDFIDKDGKSYSYMLYKLGKV